MKEASVEDRRLIQAEMLAQFAEVKKPQQEDDKKEVPPAHGSSTGSS